MYTNGKPHYAFSQPSLLALERDLQIALHWHKGTAGAGAVLEAWLRDNPDLCLDVVDYLLHRLSRRLDSHKSHAKALEDMLQQAGSAWRVGARESHFSLERRVDETVQAAAELSTSQGGRAGKHLALAWAEAYGRSPDPSASYRESVRAVEAAAQPVVSPANSKATLGTMIADLRNKPEKWALVFREHPSVDVVIAMMTTIWKGQLDRHGTADADAPLAVSQAEAEAAVHLAATLVRWFSGGSVAPASTPPS